MRIVKKLREDLGKEDLIELTAKGLDITKLMETQIKGTSSQEFLVKITDLDKSIKITEELLMHTFDMEWESAVIAMHSITQIGLKKTLMNILDYGDKESKYKFTVNVYNCGSKTVIAYRDCQRSYLEDWFTRAKEGILVELLADKKEEMLIATTSDSTTIYFLDINAVMSADKKIDYVGAMKVIKNLRKRLTSTKDVHTTPIVDIIKEELDGYK